MRELVRRWWFWVAVVAVVVIGMIALVAVLDDGDNGTTATTGPEVATTAPGTGTAVSVPAESGPTSSPTSLPDTAAPVTEVPTTEPPDQAGVGDTIDIADESIARLNSIETGAAPIGPAAAPPAGSTLSRIDIESCGDSQGLALDPAFFSAVLDDGSIAQAAPTTPDSPGLPIIGLGPYSCGRGTVDLIVPDGRTLTKVLMTDSVGVEIGQWLTDGTGGPPDAPLAPRQAPDVGAIGQQMSATDASGNLATVHSVEPDAAPAAGQPPPLPGRQLVGIDVEQCAGPNPLTLDPNAWFVTGTDNTLGSALSTSLTLPVIELAPGQCASGHVDLDLPAGVAPFDIVLTNSDRLEVMRVRLT